MDIEGEAGDELREWHAKQKAKAKKWYGKNAESVKARCRQYYHDNKEKIKMANDVYVNCPKCHALLKKGCLSGHKRLNCVFRDVNQ